MCIQSLCRRHHQISTLFHLSRGATVPSTFQLHDSFLSLEEQRILLEAALQKLDSSESAKYRKLRRLEQSSRIITSEELQDAFYPDEYYELHPGHYDGVIKNYREAEITSWLQTQRVTRPPIAAIFERVRSVIPSGEIQAHVLHLGASGEILPHIDNVSASGNWIVGISLGATRVLQMRSIQSKESFGVLLRSGSIYIQR